MTATRSLGFRLSVVGSNKTISELARIEKAMTNVKKQIRAIQSPPIKLRTQFDTKELQTLVKKLQKVGKTKLNPEIQATIKDLRAQLKLLGVDLASAQKQIDKVKSPDLSAGEVEKVNGALDKMGNHAKDAASSITKLKPALANVGTKEALELANSLAQVQIKLDKLRGEKLSIKTDKTLTDNAKASLLEPLIAQEKQLQQQQTQLNREITLATKAFINQRNSIPDDSIVALEIEISKLTKQYRELSKAELEAGRGQELQTRLATITEEVKGREAAVGNFRRNVGNYQSAITGLLPKLEELQREGILAEKELIDIFRGDLIAKEKALRDEIGKLAQEFKELGTEVANAGSRAAVLEKLEDKTRELTSTRSALESYGNTWTNLGGKLSRISDVITGGLIGGGIVALTASLMLGARQAIAVNREFADTQADVRKTTGLTQQEVAELAEEFKTFDTRTATKDLLKIAAIAGQLGVESKRGVLEFTKAIDVLNVALGDELSGGAETIANTIAKLSNVLFGATTDGERLAENMLYIGNALNVLSAEGAAGSEAIVTFASRIGRSLIPIGATADQVLALSATFDELNILPEQGATAVNNLIKDIGANTKLFAETLKINQDELRNTFNTDPIAAFDVVLRRVLELSGGDKTTTLNLLKDLRQTGEGVSTVFLQLSSNAELYQKNLKSSSSAIKETSSLFNEFRVKNENVAGVFDKLTKKMQDLATDPNIIKLIETLGNVLTGTVEVVGEAFGALSALFDRITTDVSENGTRLEQSLTGVTTGVLTMSEAQYTLLKGVSSVNAAIIKERAILESSIKILADETASRVTRNKVIDSLLEKYPGLLNKYQLEGASNKELIEIQKEVSAVMEAEVFKRIKAKTLEQLQTQRINLEILKAELELGQGLGKIQGLLAGLFGKTDEVIALRKDQVTKELADLSTQIGKSEEVFNKTANNLNINFENVFNDKSYSKVRSNLAGLISIIEQGIDNNKIDQKVNALVLSVSDQATQLINSLKVDASKEELDAAFSTTVRLQKEYEAALGKTSGTQKGLVDLQNLGVDAEKKQADAAKELSEQLERIRDLQEKIKDLKIESIDDEFVQKIERVKEDTRREIEEIQIDLNSLELKAVKTNTDNIEIAKSKELIKALEESEVRAINQINDERNKAFTESRKRLEETRDEILKIAREISGVEIDFRIKSGAFDLARAEREIEITFESNQDELQRQLDDGLLDQEEFSRQSQSIEASRLAALDNLYSGYAKEYIAQRQRMADAELKLLDRITEGKKQAVRDELALDLSKIGDDLATGKYSSKAEADEAAVARIAKASEEMRAIDAQYAVDKLAITEGLQNDVARIQDQATEAHRANMKAQTAITKEEAEKQKSTFTKLWEEFGRQLKENAYELVADITSAIADIDEATSEQTYERERSRIEKLYDTRLESAEGSAEDQKRIEREKAQKLDELDKQQSEKRKKAAITRALLEQSLAVVKAFSDLGPIAGAIAAVFIGLKTAIEIAKMRRQTFATGVYLNRGGRGGYTGASLAPPDVTGERPVGDAVVHEREYISPRKQTMRHPWLFDILDDDRNRTNAGQPSQLEDELAYQIVMRRRQTISRLVPPTFKTMEPVYPVYVPPRLGGDSLPGITDEQIDRIAEVIADRVGRATERGSNDGTSRGLRDATREALRRERTTKRMAV